MEWSGWRGGRSGVVKVGNEPGANCRVGQTSLNIEHLCLNFLGISVTILSLSGEPFELIYIAPIPVDISYHPWVSEASDRVVDEDTSSVGGVEDAVVCVFRPRAMDVG